MAAVADEEHASAGAEALVEVHAADGAVVTEPTDLRVATAHKGFEWVEVETRGRAAHGSRPDDGRDAVLHMGRVLGRLEAVEARLKAGRTHPRLGRASLHASTIHGGQALSVYPDRCVLGVERRTLVGEPPNAGLAETLQALSELAREDADFDASARQLLTRAPHETADDHPLCEELRQILRRLGLEDRPTGMSFWTDAAILGGVGTPAVLFGPTGAGLHGPDRVRGDRLGDHLPRRTGRVGQRVLLTPGNQALRPSSFTYQRSTSRPGTRENSSVLRVTSVSPLDRAMEAIIRSLAPMGRPSRRSWVLMTP